MKNEKGYILISSLLLFMLVMLISMTLINICITNYEIQDIYVKSKEGFYISEGYLDKSYLEVVKHVDFSIETANNKVEDFLENEYDKFVQEEKNKERQGLDSEYIDLREDEFGIHFVINKEKIDEKLNYIFKEQYEKCFLKIKYHNRLVKNIKKLNSQDVKLRILDENFDIKGDKINFKIVSSYTKNKMINEIVQGYYIDVPNKDDIYNEDNIGCLIGLRDWFRRK
ncbi:hypothetical protein [Tepidibacter hydrothermalis]|uniref:Uncharacterized protein n=1 Tax=Tepidibacter hydrothermalis TaxID=3036126 RepID=A0ABY8EDR8_9FIRM|nr:hypothetical protein [Tepidibacter hydrothermalis]WFD08985.1 hypothetical protein P4S50_11365 [Tepidibacter hydrothermalis]